jgi:putative N6-adenine-specific DNA methylase
MIARNIAPWLKRNFSIVDLWLISKKEIQKLKEEARKKIFDSKYKIFASDINEEVLEIARKNAFNAQVLDTIKFEKKDFRNFLDKSLSWTLVINPPYWLRLETNLEKLYKDIDFIFRKNPELKWGFISNYLDFDSKINKKKNIYKKRKLYNWAQLCYFWKKL